MRLEAEADVLRDDHRVGDGDVVADEVVEVVACAAQSEPLASPEPVPAEGDHEGRFQDHVLLEVQLVEPALPLRVSGEDERDAVEVAGGRSAGDSVGADLLDQFGMDRVRLELAYGAVAVEKGRKTVHCVGASSRWSIT